MQRGMISLTSQEIRYLLQTSASIQQAPPELSSRLQSALQQIQSESIEIELSEDSVEVLLDSLPMPEEGEPESLKKLRATLQQFLYKLRRG